MAHGTKIGGTNYGISGGKCRVNGTNYSIKKGRTLVGGTNYSITFVEPVTVRLIFKNDLDDGRGNQSYICYAKIGSTTYTADASVEVSAGETITYYVSKGSNSRRSWYSGVSITDENGIDRVNKSGTNSGVTGTVTADMNLYLQFYYGIVLLD